MTYILRSLRLVLPAAAFFSLLVPAAHATVVRLGAYAYGGGDAYPHGDAGSVMRNPENFATFGVDGFVSAGEVSYGSVTSAYLSGVDIFFTDRGGITGTPTETDIASLVSFVDAGGVLIVNNDRSTTFTSLGPLLNAFGISLETGDTNAFEALTVTDATHPIMDGPFGSVGEMTLRDASRYGVSGDATAVATWPNNDAAIAVVEPGPTRLGAVIALPDVERFLTDFDASVGAGDTEIAALNAIAYAASVASPSAVPEPSSAVYVGLAGVLFLFLRRRMRQK